MKKNGKEQIPFRKLKNTELFVLLYVSKLVSYPWSVGQKIFLAATEKDGSTNGDGVIFFFAMHPSGYFGYGVVGNKLDRLGVRCGYKNNAKGQQGDFKHTGYGVYALLNVFIPF